MPTHTFAAADSGATNGRVILGRVAPHTIALRETHRFLDTPIPLPDGLRWDLAASGFGTAA